MSEKVDKLKSKGKPKVKTNAQTVEWDSNASSTNCILCKSVFGTFTNRRHHCRNCGRLVCESCSSQRFKLGGDNTSELPQRVCDACYDMLRQKREMKLQVVQIKDKNLELMLSTSYISDSLINLFYLDGSTKTVGIDDTTTISELALLACPVMKLALFEVMQNIQAVSQYKLLLPNQNVVALLDTWQKNGQPYSKVVIPLNNAACAPSAGGPPSTDNYDGDFRQSFRSSVYDGGAGRASMMSPTTPPPAVFTPSPTAKSIYKVKQSPGITSPIFLAAPSELMGTSYDSNRSELQRSPPSSPMRATATAGHNHGTDSPGPTHAASMLSGLRMVDDNSTVSSSFTDQPHQPQQGEGFQRAASGLTTQGNNLAAELVAKQVQVHSLEVSAAYS
jgi:hypothetical protein